AAGLAATFGNPTYESAFTFFSPTRLFSPVGSNVSCVKFFLPGGGELPASTNAFGAVFSDVDQQNGLGFEARYDRTNTVVEYYGVYGELLYRAEVPASPGTATLSFFGVIFKDPRIAKVKIVTGDVAPGPNDGRKDIVMMDDFIYGEPVQIK